MWSFQRIDPLSAFIGKKYVSFIGGGGKTSLTEYCAARAQQKGLRPLICTTTKIWAREPYAPFASGEWRTPRIDGVLRVGKSAENGKLTGLTSDEVKAVGEGYDLVLVEADGSRNLPLKYPAPFEPVIPPFTDLTVVLAGLDALSGAIVDKVFRSELLAEKRGIATQGRVTTAFFADLFQKDGMLKDVDMTRCLVVLNKYDACPEREAVPDLARQVAERTGGAEVVIASVRHEIFYRLKRE